MNRMANTGYVPILIVAQDENDKYIHIKDAKENTNYFCPCCHQPVKMRAKSSKKVQPHFYHITESPCVNSETLIHWTYKNWLFIKGSQFKLSDEDELHTVEKIDIENIYHTNFGDYQPDITVYDSNGMRFFFEINYSNKKKYLNYADKWCELNSKVVEINVKDLIDSSFNGTVPEFDILFKDGKYFGRLEKQNDSDVYVRLQERKTIVNSTKKHDLEYMNKLDSVWKCVQKYTKKEIDENEFLLLSDFENLDYEDQYIFAEIIKRMKCVKSYDRIIILVLNSYVKNFKNQLDKICKNNKFPMFNIVINSIERRVLSKYITLSVCMDNFEDETIFTYDWKILKLRRNGLPENKYIDIKHDDILGLNEFCKCVSKFRKMIRLARETNLKNINMKLYLQPRHLFNYEMHVDNIDVKFFFTDKKTNLGITNLLKNENIIYDAYKRFYMCNDEMEISNYLKDIDLRYAVGNYIKHFKEMMENDKEYQSIHNNIESELCNLQTSINNEKFSYNISTNSDFQYQTNDKIYIQIQYDNFILSGLCSYQNIITTSEMNQSIKIMFENFKKHYKIIDFVYKINNLINNAKNRIWSSELLFYPNCIYLDLHFTLYSARTLNTEILYMLDNEKYYNHLKYNKIKNDCFSTRIPLVESDIFSTPQTLTYNVLTCAGNDNITFDILKKKIADSMNELLTNIENSVWFLYDKHEIRFINKATQEDGYEL